MFPDLPLPIGFVASDIRSNEFYLGFRGNAHERELNTDVIRKNDAKLSERERELKAEYLRAVKTEQLGFASNYLKKPIKDYGLAAKKIKQILVTGTYRYEDASAIKRRLKSPEDIRKEKSEKAIKKITALEPYEMHYAGNRNKAKNFDDFEFKLRYYGNDISEKEHAAEIVSSLKLYEKDAKQVVEKIQKIIRDWEDRFPSIVQDPVASGLAKPQNEEEKEEK